MDALKVCLVTVGLLMAGCEWLVPVDGLSGGDAGPPPACSLDLSKDRLNCGSCGHSCLGGECVEGRCQPATIADDQSGPLGIDVSAHYVFWVNQSPPGLMRWNKDGSAAPRPIASPTDLVQEPFDIAADADERLVYWTDLTSAQVFRKPVEGGPAQPFGNGGPGQAAFVSVDGAQVYVSDFHEDFGSIATGDVLYSERAGIGGLAVRGGIVYFALKSMPAQILAGPSTGATTAGVLVDAIVGRPMGLAVDDNNIYWIEDGQRLKQASRHGGGTPVTLYESPQPFGPSDLAADAAAVYWTEHGLGPVGRVRRLAH
jgi:hypothetical protein